MIIDVANLECWECTPTHPLIKQFTRFYELETYAEESEEVDVSFAVQLVKKYGGRKLKTYINKLREDELYIKGDFYNNIKEVEYQLTTAHRSKGLEYKVVALLDDFQEITQMISNDWHKDYTSGALQGQDLEDYTQEVNLLYVAATRGKEALYMPYNINSALKSVI
jgi:ATP-dependent exoDNAse (exonuclease V) beta subunit